MACLTTMYGPRRTIRTGSNLQTTFRINDPNGIHLRAAIRYNGINEQRNNHNGRHNDYKSGSNILQNGKIDRENAVNGHHRVSVWLNPVQNGYLNRRRYDDQDVLKRQPIIIGQNATNGDAGYRKSEQIHFQALSGVRDLLRPTVTQNRQENKNVEYDIEDLHGPYNFRQLLRPAEYLPTESLRKRKGGLTCNEVQIPKDKVPQKHVKRRAPLPPNQDKIVVSRK